MPDCDAGRECIDGGAVADVADLRLGADLGRRRSRSRSSPRATRTQRQPCSASSRARSAPIPLEPPVIDGHALVHPAPTSSSRRSSRCGSRWRSPHAASVTTAPRVWVPTVPFLAQVVRVEPGGARLDRRDPLAVDQELARCGSSSSRSRRRAAAIARSRADVGGRLEPGHGRRVHDRQLPRDERRVRKNRGDLTGLVDVLVLLEVAGHEDRRRRPLLQRRRCVREREDCDAGDRVVGRGADDDLPVARSRARADRRRTGGRACGRRASAGRRRPSSSPSPRAAG